MKNKYLWIGMIAGAAALALVVGVGAWVAGVAQAAANPVSASNAEVLPDDPIFGPWGPGGWGGGQVDFQQLLADELGISLQELQEAIQAAHDEALRILVDEGVLTQEQADLMGAARQLRAFLAPDELIAEALDMSPEAFRQARSDGQTLDDLLDERDMDRDEFREALAAAGEAAIAQAVEDGVITQDQADALEEGMQPGFGPWHRGPRGFLKDGFFGPGGRMGPFHPDE